LALTSVILADAKINNKRDDIMVAFKIGAMAFAFVGASLGLLELVHLTGLI